MTDEKDYVSQAVEESAADEQDVMSLSDFVDRVVDDPSSACTSSQYLLRAIESEGTRTVVEHGEELERYRFFDDPHNDGEHAIIGNTAVLNEFVEDLRQQAHGSANEEKLFWFEGPTATGKSELKRCIINGVREYSKTPEGRRYTIEWNSEGSDSNTSKMTYGDDSGGVERQWFPSPVQANPLSVLPESVRRRVIEDAGFEDADEIIDNDLDPFSREAVRILEDDLGNDQNAYNEIFSDDHLRVRRYDMDVGQGIGVLQSEDHGKPANKLVGQWMKGMMQEFDSRGRRNPHAFSYDGVLAQGNSGVSIVEDASHHTDMMTKLLNIVDDDVAKMDRQTSMSVDTVLLVISNLDFGEQMVQTRGSGADPLKALRRRMQRYNLWYLVTYSLEAELIRRMLTDDTTVWTENTDHEVREPVFVDETELAPHTVEAVAFYEVMTRLNDTTLQSDLTYEQRVHLYNDGEVEHNDEIIEIDDVDMKPEEEGQHGIPVTYTRDVLADLIADQDVVMPEDALDALVGNLDSTVLFASDNTQEMRNRVEDVERYIFGEQEDDVRDAMLRHKQVSEESLEEYVEIVTTWVTEGEDADLDENDLMTMKVFETDHLGFNENDYVNGIDPAGNVYDFRKQEIVQGITSYLNERRNEDVDVSDVPMSEIPVLEDLIDNHEWYEVAEEYPDFDPSRWGSPLDGTETKEVKEMTITNMQEMFDYSEESARKTANRVMEEVRHAWGTIETQVNDDPEKAVTESDL